MSILDGDAIKGVQHISLPNDVTAVNVYYFTASFAEDQAEVTVVGALEAWIEALYTTLLAKIKSNVSMADLYCYRKSGVLWDLFGTGLPDLTFTGTAELLPHGVCGLVRAYTEYPRTIGRKYIPGFMEGASADGVWTAGQIADMGDFAEAWDNQAIIDGSNVLLPGVYSVLPGFVRALTGDFVVGTYPAYQRRRRPGVGI